jgi:8-oxo-dGTP pyrophosphatase MutT (NUDIX family)
MYNLLEKRTEGRLIYCANCGEVGHIVRECLNPLTSFGLISFKIVEYPEDKDLNKELKDIVASQGHPEISDTKYPLIKFLLIQRKDTMGYIDFLRGKYPSNDLLVKNRMTRRDVRKRYIDEMTKDERERVLCKTFEEKWNSLWVNKNSRPYRNEKLGASKHYIEHYQEACEYINSTEPKWFFTEFSFPKGRKQLRENNQRCAQREFQEETCYTDYDYSLLKSRTFDEKFIGTNLIPYTHIYYLARAANNIRMPKVDWSNQMQTGEVKNIGWFTVDQAFSLIRDYDWHKKKVLLEVYEYLLQTNYSNMLNISSSFRRA